MDLNQHRFSKLPSLSKTFTWKKLSVTFGSSITQGIYRQNNVIRSYPVHTCSFISKWLSALWQTGSVTFYHGEVSWAPAAHPGVNPDFPAAFCGQSPMEEWSLGVKMGIKVGQIQFCF